MRETGVMYREKKDNSCSELVHIVSYYTFFFSVVPVDLVVKKIRVFCVKLNIYKQITTGGLRRENQARVPELKRPGDT